jgi:hypothetical protein
MKPCFSFARENSIYSSQSEKNRGNVQLKLAQFFGQENSSKNETRIIGRKSCLFLGTFFLDNNWFHDSWSYKENSTEYHKNRNLFKLI